MAEKETLAKELDRKRASPTESAVMREMVKGTLWSRYAEPAVILRFRRHIRLAHVMRRERRFCL
jgi:hypothetical protein